MLYHYRRYLRWSRHCAVQSLQMAERRVSRHQPTYFRLFIDKAKAPRVADLGAFFLVITCNYIISM